MSVDGVSYSGTEYLSGCFGLDNYAYAATYTFHQSAGSCSVNVDAPKGDPCSGSISGNTVEWACSQYTLDGETVTPNTARATISTDLSTLSGSFAWTAGSCTSGETTFNNPALSSAK